MTIQRNYDGLSPSSLALFTSCQKKYYYKKIAKHPIDSDASEDTEAFQIGKAFHKVLEDTRHVLKDVSYDFVKEICATFGLEEFEQIPMVFAMLSKYSKVHNAAGLKAIAFEVPVETKEFFGIVDVVLKNAQGGWYIGDMKTAASYNPAIIPTLFNHPQLSLYTAHYKVLAESLDIDPEKFMGCRYRLTTKSKLVRKRDEELATYISRLSKAIKSLDFAIPKENIKHELTLTAHTDASNYIKANADDESKFSCNLGNCTQYFKPCEYWSRCHGKLHSEMQSIFVVTSD